MTHIILYYNFTRIENLPKFSAEHRRTCKALGLSGRVYVASEGINGTLAGDPSNIAAYKDFLRSLPGFALTQFKDDTHPTMPFAKLIVRMRPEIVTLKTKIAIDMTQERGRHLSPRQWRCALESNEDVTLLDVRNNYESRIGHFEGAITPDVENFYDFEDWLDHAGLKKDKKVLMYCTGGIRCEKFSLLMEKKGFKDVYQLGGGILGYKKEEGGAHFRGKCFVFDDRLAVAVEENQKEPLAFCEITGLACDRYLNCANPDCNKLFICSPQGAGRFEGCCSEACLKAERRRPFDPANIYEPTRKWYTYLAQRP
jgi:UPF0176 protein